MKNLSILVAGVAMALTAGTALAQATPAAPAASAPAASGKHYTTAESTIGDLLADPAAKAVIDKHIPGLSDSPSISMASGMTFAQIQPMSNGAITEKMLADIDADFAKLPSK